MNRRKKCLLMAGAFLCLNVASYSQAITLNMSKIPVDRAIVELQQKSGYSFVYVTGDLDLQKTVTVKATQLNEAIEQILNGQNVTFDIQGKNIIIKRKGQSVSQNLNNTISGIIKDTKGAPIIGATIDRKSVV